ncbi:BMP family protein [Celeribacter sp.]|uniref:BMP family protein n=1 Tax=Celeribacter sp. TaxID=1890673 RepID=UPI003A8D0706
MTTRQTRRAILRAALLAAPMLLPAVSYAQTSDTALKIAMIMPGPITDNDWNSVGYNGLQAAGEALGAEVAYAENVTDADAERLLRDFASRGYDLVFAHSFSFGDAALNAAESFPKTIFMAGTASEPSDNLGTYSNPDYQGAYLAGMLAAGATETGTVGWVGGMPAPNMLANLHAYKAGAMEVNAEVNVLHTFIGSWFDPPKAKEATIAQIEQGADVVSAQGVGVIDGAAEKGVLALGAMTDQNFLGEETVLTSVTWDLGPLITAVGEAVLDGSWASQNWSYGVASDSVGLAPFHGLDTNVDTVVMEAVEAKIAAIKDGSFEVPLDTSPVD